MFKGASEELLTRFQKKKRQNRNALTLVSDDKLSCGSGKIEGVQHILKITGNINSMWC